MTIKKCSIPDKVQDNMYRLYISITLKNYRGDFTIPQTVGLSDDHDAIIQLIAFRDRAKGSQSGRNYEFKTKRALVKRFLSMIMPLEDYDDGR